MNRQTRRPDQWIVVDDGKIPTACTMGQTYVRREPRAADPTHTLTLNLMMGMQRVRGDKVVIVEDDDWYSPDYLEWMGAELDRGTLAGEGRAIYYNVMLRAWYQHNNTDRASLCSTGFSAALLPNVARLCRSPDPFLDMRLWRTLKGRVTTPSHRRVIGIKGMPGRRGIGIGHRTDNPRWQADHDLVTLYALLGSDADAYRSIAESSTLGARPAIAS
jgi:glycosyltransferase involved in cell wall biosynthesis